MPTEGQETIADTKDDSDSGSPVAFSISDYDGLFHRD